MSAVILRILIFLFIFSGLINLNSTLLILSIPLIVYLLAGMFNGPERVSFTAKRRFSQNRVPYGTPVTVSVLVTNTGPAMDEALIEDYCPSKIKIIQGSNRLITHLPPGASAKIEYTIRGERGHFTSNTVYVRANDTFGLIQKEGKQSCPGDLFFLPSVKRQKEIPIAPRKTLIYAGVIPTRIGGRGVQFFDIREYQPGDPMRYINTRATARRPDILFTNEFEEERVADVGIILDARMCSNPKHFDTSLMEYSIQAAAGLSEAFLDSGNRVGLLVYGSILDWSFPGYGKHQREKIFNSLTSAEEGQSLVFEKLDNIPTRLFPSGSQIVLVSPLLAEDIPFLIRLRARGYRLLIISPDPVSFEISGKTLEPEECLGERIMHIERRQLFRELEKAGIFVIDWDVNLPFNRVLFKQLRRMKTWYRHGG